MSAFQICIELNSRRLILKTANEIYNTFPVAIGKPGTPTPTGDFHVINKINNPGGVLGTRWMQFTSRNHGIHGTSQPWLIGQAVSHGCVRMYNQDVEVVFARVQIGDPVTVSNSFQGICPEINRGTGNNPSPYPGGSANKPISDYIIYTVKPNDSLWKISQKYGITINQIKSLNNLQGNTIYPGQQLKIPAV